MRTHPAKLAGTHRQGIVLFAVLIVVVVLTLAAYQFAELMTAEYRAADSTARLGQARALANSGINYAAALLSDPASFTGTLNSNPFDNATVFQDVIVQANDKPRFQGRFSVVAPIDPLDPAYGSQPFRFGVVDESGKINLNALLKVDSKGKVAHDMLMTFPNMTETIANSILDWIDVDVESRPNGAESDYYSALTPPYNCKNGPLDSVEELLLVQGITSQLLLGNDLNRNGLLEPSEDDGSGVVNVGWAPYFTPFSREWNVSSLGAQRLNVNQTDLAGMSEQLKAIVGENLGNYVLAYRLYGSSLGGGKDKGAGAASGGALPAKALQRLNRDKSDPALQRNATPIASLFDLIDSSVDIPSDERRAPPTRFHSPLNNRGTLLQSFPLLWDQVSTVNTLVIPARINVNTAPTAVLSALPGLTAADVQNILTNRPSVSSTDPPDPSFQTPTWLITTANIDAQKLKALDKYITTQTQVYRVQALGYFDSGGPTARVEAVIYTNYGRPRILYWRDLGALGKGFDLSATTPQQ